MYSFIPAPSRKPGGSLTGLAAIGEAGLVEGVDLVGGFGDEADGAAIGAARILAVDRLGHSEGAAFVAPEDAVAVDGARLGAERAERRVIEYLGLVEVVGPDHHVRKHV